VVLLRLGGKRDLAQLNSFDLVVLLLLANVVQNAVIGNDNSLDGGFTGAAILIAVNAIVVRLSRRNHLAIRVFEGEPTVLVHQGEVNEHNVNRLGLRRADIEVAVRRQAPTELIRCRGPPWSPVAFSWSNCSRSSTMPPIRMFSDLRTSSIESSSGWLLGGSGKRRQLSRR
jgi:hypothetical protein